MNLPAGFESGRARFLHHTCFVAKTWFQVPHSLTHERRECARHARRPCARYLVPHPLKPAPAAVAQWYQPPAHARNGTVEVERGFESTRGAFSEKRTSKNACTAIAMHQKASKNGSKSGPTQMSEPHFEVPRFISKRSKTNKINANP